MNQNELSLVKKDMMRFRTNKLSSGLALLGVVVNVIYFISVYKVDGDATTENGLEIYKPLLAISVIYNLLFMLFTILASQGIQAYSNVYCVMLLATAGVQIARIFILPAKYLELSIVAEGKFILWSVLLVASAALLIAAAIIGFIKNKTYHDYVASTGPELA
jgi:hypothetical protein